MARIIPISLCIAVVLFAQVQAFADTFVVNCAPLTIQRSDPIISPGVASSHVHSIVGGNAFNRSMVGINFPNNNANQTTCDKKLDRSSYWVPQLYHGRSDGTFEMVPWTGAAIYYQNRACNYTTSSQYCDKTKVALAFPPGFRMVAGDTTRRTQNDSDFSNLAVNMMCMNDDTSIQYQGFPPTHCKTIRAEVYFPSCWDGVNITSADHKSHVLNELGRKRNINMKQVAYPEVGNFDGGVCPQSHPVAIFSIFYEFFFDTSSYTDTNRFVFANGDNTGYGFHGDFIMGWTNRTALQLAFETCIGDGDALCPINTEGAAPGENHQGPATLLYPAIYEEDLGFNNPIAKLPGNNPVNFSANGIPRAKISVGGKFAVSFGKTTPLVVNGTLAQASIFDVVTSAGTVTVRNEADGEYVSADNYGANPLIANRDSAQGWETYTLTALSDGNYTLTAAANNQYVALQSDNTLLANGGTTVSHSTALTFVWL